MRTLAKLVLISVPVFLALPEPAVAQVECARCHANRDFLIGKQAPPGVNDSTLYVGPAVLEGTVHQGLKCTDCHRGFEAGYPHRVTAVVVPCKTCHAQQGADWEASVHALNASTKGDAPTCVRCHGSHLIYSAKDPRSPTYPLNVAAKCGGCHGDARIIGTYFARPEKEEGRVAVAEFPKSVHGAALTRDGLVVSATCSDCHGAHKILPADSSESSVNRAHIPATCGACHQGLVATFDSSAHSPTYPRRPGADSLRRPVCIDCHTAHAISRVDRPHWLTGVVGECGKCHERLYETYLETYHGKVTRLGDEVAARCSDCHTAHSMRPASDPRSSVYPANLVATCGRCHANVNANFVKYYAHGDPTQRAKYPRLYWPWLFMTALLISVMAFFGLHTVLWLIRLGIDRARGGGGGEHHGMGGGARP